MTLDARHLRGSDSWAFSILNLRRLTELDDRRFLQPALM